MDSIQPNENTKRSVSTKRQKVQENVVVPPLREKENQETAESSKAGVTESPMKDVVTNDHIVEEKLVQEQNSADDTLTLTQDKEEPEEENVPHYLDFSVLTKEIMTECVSFSKVFAVKKICNLVYINFNFRKFRMLRPDIKIEEKDRKLTFLKPFLKTSFGYSPITINQIVQNNIRHSFADYVDDQGPKYYEICKVWDEFFLDAAEKRANEWGLGKLCKTTNPTREDLRKVYTPIVRNSEDSENPQYCSSKFKTQKEDRVNDITENKYTAKVEVWSQKRDKNGEVVIEFVCDELTKENAVPSKEDLEDEPSLKEKRKIIVDAGDYTKEIVQFEKIYIGNGQFGPNTCTTILSYAKPDFFQKSKDKKRCVPSAFKC